MNKKPKKVLPVDIPAQGPSGNTEQAPKGPGDTI